MNAEVLSQEIDTLIIDPRSFNQLNPFLGEECVLKKCCKKFKKGKRCKKCPD